MDFANLPARSSKRARAKSLVPGPFHCPGTGVLFSKTSCLIVTSVPVQVANLRRSCTDTTPHTKCVVQATICQRKAVAFSAPSNGPASACPSNVHTTRHCCNEDSHYKPKRARPHLPCYKPHVVYNSARSRYTATGFGWSALHVG